MKAIFLDNKRVILLFLSILIIVIVINLFSLKKDIKSSNVYEFSTLKEGDIIPFNSRIVGNFNLRKFYKLNKNIYRSVKESLIKVENNKNMFYTNEKKLNNKKEMLFNKGDISKWGIENQKNVIDNNELLKNKKKSFELMLTKENNNVLDLKKFYGYYLNMFYKEYDRIKYLNGFKHLDNNFVLYAQLIQHNIEWKSKLSEFIINIENEKKIQNKKENIYFPFELEEYLKNNNIKLNEENIENKNNN